MNHTCHWPGCTDNHSMKICTGCGTPKPASAFSKNRMGAMGLHSRCKECRSADYISARSADPEKFRERGRAWQRENPELGKAYRARYRLSLKRDALTAYGGNPPKCACCGESAAGFLTIDHINGGGREHKREIGSKLYSWLKQHDYPEGFRVLCFNCNFAIWAYGVCPHVDPISGSLGQENDKNPSEQYIAAAQSARNWILENRPT